MPFRRVCCLARPGTTRRASGVPGAAPGRPAVLPGGFLTGTEACCFSSRTSPFSETQVANLAGFGAGKPERGACASRCGARLGPECWVISAGRRRWVTTGTRLWIQTPAAWLRGTQSCPPVRALISSGNDLPLGAATLFCIIFKLTAPFCGGTRDIILAYILIRNVLVHCSLLFSFLFKLLRTVAKTVRILNQVFIHR